MTKLVTNPHTLARTTGKLAIQCVDNKGQTGSFLFQGDITDKAKLVMLTPTFPDLVALYDHLRKNGWTHPQGDGGTYSKISARNFWIIDKDLITEGGKPGTHENAVGLIGPRSAKDANLAPLTLRFRLLDDDGEVMYEGRMLPFELHDDESFGDEPLTQFGMGNVGATCLEYWTPGKGGGWTTL